MTRRSWIVWLLVLCLGFLACGAGALALLVASMAPVFEAMFEQAAAVFLAELAFYVTLYVALMATLEIAILADIWATRGPIMALAWALLRVAAWSGG